MTIREEVSKVLGVRVEEGHWDEAFKSLDTTGRFNQRVIFELMLLILKRLDAKDNL